MMEKFPGRIIAFSGIDGAGKSTQIDNLKKTLQEKGKRVVCLWTRGGYTGPFNSFKGILRRMLGKRLPPPGRNQKREKAFRKRGIRTTWLSLAMLDLILLYAFYFRWLKWTGRYVIADRYLWDTWVDFKLNFTDSGSEHWLLWKILERVSPEPDNSFLLSIPVEESLRRSKMKNEPFPDSKAVLRQRLNLYSKIAADNNFHVIDCRQSIMAVHLAIIKHLSL